MGLLKQNTSVALRAVPFSMVDIERQASAILTRARQQAAQLLGEAQKAAEELKRQGKVDGVTAGYREGKKKGLEEGRQSGHAQALAEHREKFTAAISALSASAEAIDTRRRALDSDALRDVVRLSVKIAERITKREARFDPEILLNNVGECLRLVVGTHDLRIAVHPGEKAVLADALPKLQLQFPALQHVELTEDAAVAPGGCRVFTRQGQIDADLDTQLRRIALELIPGSE